MGKIIAVGILIAVMNGLFWGGIVYEIYTHWHDITAAIGSTGREVSDSYNNKH